MYCKTNSLSIRYLIFQLSVLISNTKKIYSCLYCLISLTLLMERKTSKGLTWLTDSLDFELGITLIHVNVSM